MGEREQLHDGQLPLPVVNGDARGSTYASDLVGSRTGSVTNPTSWRNDGALACLDGLPQCLRGLG